MLLKEILQHKDTVIAVIALINIFSFFLFAYDKAAAKRKSSRIPEKRLLISAFCFGSAGAMAGMYLLRHKTRKTKFVVTVPLFLLIHVAILYFIGVIC